MYTDHRVEYDLGSLDITGTTPLFLTPGHQPMRVRAVGIVLTTALSVAASVITVERAVTPGSVVGAVSLGTITIPATGAIGEVYWGEFDDVVSPGDQLAVVSDGVTTTGAGRVVVAVEPKWETPENNASMIEKTS